MSTRNFYDRLVTFEKRLKAEMMNVFNPTHLCLGQEEVPVAMHENIQPQDWFFSTHRAHGHALAGRLDESYCKAALEQNCYGNIGSCCSK